MKMILLLLADGFEEIEALGTADVLRRLELDVVTASIGSEVVTGAHNIKVFADTLFNKINKAEFKTLITLLNPVAPHITEELWQIAGFEGVLSDTSWPVYDEAKTVDDEIEIVAQINCKVKCKLLVGADEAEDSIKEKALAEEKIAEAIAGKTVVKVIVIPKRLVNIVVK